MLKLTPSSAGKFVPCPGSVRAELAHPDRREPSPVLMEGRAADWLIARVVASRWSFNTSAPTVAADWIGQVHDGITIDGAMAEHVTNYVDHLEEAAGSLDIVKIEHQLSMERYLAGYNGRSDATARLDEGRHARAWDFKYGFRPVYAFENYQLISYGLGLMTVGVDRFTLSIVQPRARGLHYDHWTLTAVELMAYADRLIKSAHEARGDNPRLATGPHCGTCSARYACGALRAASGAALDYVTQSELHEPTPVELGAELRLMRQALTLAKARLSGLEEQAIYQLNHGQSIPGWRMTSTLSNRAFDDRAKTERLAALHRVSLATDGLCTPAEAERRGLPKPVVKMLTTRQPGAPKLDQLTTRDIERIFKP